MKMNKYRSLNENQKQIRLSIMNMIIDKKRPVSLDEVTKELKETLKLDENLLKESLNLFLDKNIMVVDENKYINYIYPVSAHDTMHQVTLLSDKKIFNAMCAIDALGWRCTFHQDIDINSKCYTTGRDIKISIRNGKVTSINNPDLRVLHLNLDKYSNWATSC